MATVSNNGIVLCDTIKVGDKIFMRGDKINNQVSSQIMKCLSEFSLTGDGLISRTCDNVTLEARNGDMSGFDKFLSLRRLKK